MNVHHLELFYYVARHRGISEAVRRMPYGIQQPAVSGQILKLESELGVKLFHRRPFMLTQSGRDLFEFIEPFFGRLEDVAERVRGEINQRLRVAASATILRDHFPAMLEELRRKFPRLKLALHDANQSMAETMLQRQEIDLAITEIEGKPAAGFQSEILLRLPLVLLVPAKSAYRSAAGFWKPDAVALETLIALPVHEAISRLFRSGLEDRRIEWPVGIEVSSIDLVEAYVAAGFGVGVSVALPSTGRTPAIRALPLTGFPTLVVAALWQDRLPPVAETFLAQAKSEAQRIAGKRR